MTDNRMEQPMDTYEVLLDVQRFQTARVAVEAESEDEAVEKAKLLVRGEVGVEISYGEIESIDVVECDLLGEPRSWEVAE